MEGPPLGPGGEDITWPDQVAPRGRKASSTRKIKPQTSNLKFLSGSEDPDVTALSEAIKAKLLLCYQKDVLELCPRSFDVFLQVGFVVENPKPKQQVEQGLNMDRINEINDWFWNPV